MHINSCDQVFFEASSSIHVDTVSLGSGLLRNLSFGYPCIWLTRSDLQNIQFSTFLPVSFIAVVCCVTDHDASRLLCSYG